MTEALTGAAVAFASAVSGGKTPQSSSSTSGASLNSESTSGVAIAAVSPGKAVELRMKNYQQLRYLQQLYEDGILSDKEFAEQKRDILDFLRKIN